MAAVASAGRFTAERQSAKLHVLFRLLRGPARQLCRDDRADAAPRRRELRTTTDERCVVVASQTQSLALVARLCVREGWPWCLLDGRTPSKERQKLADGFNAADLRNVCTEAGMFAIRAERDYCIEEDFMKAVRKVAENKKLEGKLDYNKV